MSTLIKKLLRLPEVLEITSMKKSFFYLQIQKGLITEPIKIGRSSYWEREAIEKFIQDQIAKRDSACSE